MSRQHKGKWQSAVGGVYVKPKKGKWKPCGYIAMSKSGTGVTIKIGTEYYFAEHPEVLEVLTKQRGYAKIYKRSG